MDALRVALGCLVGGAVTTAAPPAAAQEYGLYLKCSGRVEARGQSRQAHLDLALRRNSSLALVQRSDVLPVGDKMKLDITPAYYSMVFRAPVRGTVVYSNWIVGPMFVWYPPFRELQTARISIDRQTAALEGDMRDGADRVLGRLTMRCQPQDNDTAPEPKF
jgi:hypothetical protein